MFEPVRCLVCACVFICACVRGLGVRVCVLHVRALECACVVVCLFVCLFVCVCGFGYGCCASVSVVLSVCFCGAHGGAIDTMAQ